MRKGRELAGWAAIGLVLLALSALRVAGACTTTSPYIDNCSGAVCGSQTGMSGGLGSTIIPYFWIAGAAGTYNSSACTANQDAIKKAGGSYQALSSWGTKDSTGGKVDCATGCPTPTGTRLIFVYSNQATGNGPGSYILMSVVYTAGDTSYNFYNISNGTANGGATVRDCATITIPTPTITGATSSGSNWLVTLTWPTITPGGGFNQLRGTTTATPAGTSSRASVSATCRRAPRPLPTYPTIPMSRGLSTSAPPRPTQAPRRSPSPSRRTRPGCGMFFVFDNGAYETLWGGPVAAQLGPTAAPLFADQTRAPRGAGFGELAEQRGEPGGLLRDLLRHSESRALRARARGRHLPPGQQPGLLHDLSHAHAHPKVFLKVRAVLLDGTEEWSGVMRVKAPLRTSDDN